MKEIVISEFVDDLAFKVMCTYILIGIIFIVYKLGTVIKKINERYDIYKYYRKLIFYFTKIGYAKMIFILILLVYIFLGFKASVILSLAIIASLTFS